MKTKFKPIGTKFVYLIFLFSVIVSIIFLNNSEGNESNGEETIKHEKHSIAGFSPKTIPSGSDSQYDIKLAMDEEGRFLLESTVTIKNTSNDSWDNLVFYFIPNISTEKVLQELTHYMKIPSAVQLRKVTLDGKQVDYELDKDTLSIPLTNEIDPGNDVKVNFACDFTLPEGGFRFTKTNSNRYLAQFYPMVATYQNHQWNKEGYRFRGESYHTAFSDFNVTYDLPDGYTLATSSDNDKYPSETNGSFRINNVKEIFLAILYQPKVIQKMEGNINIRVFGSEEKEDLYGEISEAASDALRYFQEIMGPYPFQQLDIVLEEHGMEYPGIVTAGSIYSSSPAYTDAQKSIVVHEIAHQWFYGVISNDPYNDAWLDEGFATFAAGLYYFSSNNKDIPYDSMYNQLENLEELPVNLPLDEYENEMSSYVYSKSSTMLFKLFEHRGGIEGAEKFLKAYYDNYKYKEIDTKEFVRFTKDYFNMREDSFFKSWLLP